MSKQKEKGGNREKYVSNIKVIKRKEERKTRESKEKRRKENSLRPTPLSFVPAKMRSRRRARAVLDTALTAR
jgi:hypothetical protein